MEHDLCFWALIVLLAPLAGFILQVFLGSRLPRRGDWLPTLCIFVSLLISTWMMALLVSSEEPIRQAWNPGWGQSWLGGEEGGLTLRFGILVDNLTIVMLFVVTVVSFLVHLYSWGYMHGEARYNYFFAYLALFSFSMLGLCIASNLLFVFVFWELVGLCSYFLIGFYFEKSSAQKAAIKAFLTTRVGDVGFFVGILIIAGVAGTLDIALAPAVEGGAITSPVFETVRQGASGPWTAGLLGVAALCLFAGAAGKSAQFPLHIWLPDAMEGPTPVSALIHAATMVAAGVYLVGRLFPLLAGGGYFEGDFASSPLLVVALIGGFTAFFAATIAFSQTDIKKVLAYSTVSQLGYMMLALGVGSVGAGLFHLFTHAFFKALLFLGSGSVIHAVHSNELDDMGGLRRKMPITWMTFAIGTLAIAGLPLLSGFYSKEAILGQAFGFMRHHDGSILHALPFLLGLTTAGMTAFYMFRLLFRTFHGEPRNAHAHERAHESPWTMTVPLCVLAFLAVVAGGFPVGGGKWFEHKVNSEVLVELPEKVLTAESIPFREVEHLAESGHGLVMGLSVAMFLMGTAGAAFFFLPGGPLYRRDVIRRGTLLWPAYVGSKNLWFVDQALTGAAIATVRAGHFACGWFDKYIVDGIVNFWGAACQFVTRVVGSVDYWGVDGTVRGLGEWTLWGGQRLRRVQTGRLQEYVYASLILFGCVVLIAAFLIMTG